MNFLNTLSDSPRAIAGAADALHADLQGQNVSAENRKAAAVIDNIAAGIREGKAAAAESRAAFELADAITAEIADQCRKARKIIAALTDAERTSIVLMVSATLSEAIPREPTFDTDIGDFAQCEKCQAVYSIEGAYFPMPNRPPEPCNYMCPECGHIEEHPQECDRCSDCGGAVYDGPRVYQGMDNGWDHHQGRCCEKGSGS